MRFRRRVVFPEPRKPVMMVTGMGAIMFRERNVCTEYCCTLDGLQFCDEKRRGSTASTGSR